MKNPGTAARAPSRTTIAPPITTVGLGAAGWARAIGAGGRDRARALAGRPDRPGLLDRPGVGLDRGLGRGRGRGRGQGRGRGRGLGRGGRGAGALPVLVHLLATGVLWWMGCWFVGRWHVLRFLVVCLLILGVSRVGADLSRFVSRVKPTKRRNIPENIQITKSNNTRIVSLLAW